MTENYNDIPMSEECKKEMSFTPADQLFLKRVLDRQDEVTQKFINDTYDTHAKIIIDVVRDMIEEQNNKIFKKIDEQNKIIKRIQDVITNIQIELKEHDTRIKKLEARMQKLLTEHDINHN